MSAESPSVEVLVALAGAAAGAVFAAIRGTAAWLFHRSQGRVERWEQAFGSIHGLEGRVTRLEQTRDGAPDPKVSEWRLSQAERDINGVGAKTSRSLAEVEQRLRGDLGRQEIRHREEMKFLMERIGVRKDP